MVDSIAKIIQYGDQYPDLFVFSPFEEEEDWGDSADPQSIDFQQRDGEYFFDSSESRKGSKTLTKRFVLRSKKFFEKYQNQKEKYGRECNSEQGYLTLLKDAYYRGIRGANRGGKLKRLYVQMEDGSIRWTWAKPQETSYLRNGADPDSQGLPLNIDFICQEPYFYELEKGINFYYSDFDLSLLVFACDLIQATPDTLLQPDSKICKQNCNENGLIIRDESLLGFLGDEACNYPECGPDPCLAYLGDLYSLTADDTIEICVNGSAGTASPLISFRDNWLNPELTNSNGDHLIYNGTIGVGEYLEIYLYVSGSGDYYSYDTNIPGFDENDLVIDNFGRFELGLGVNSLQIEGVNGPALFTINILNKYHN